MTEITKEWKKEVGMGWTDKYSTTLKYFELNNEKDSQLANGIKTVVQFMNYL